VDDVVDGHVDGSADDFRDSSRDLLSCGPHGLVPQHADMDLDVVVLDADASHLPARQVGSDLPEDSPVKVSDTGDGPGYLG